MLGGTGVPPVFLKCGPSEASGRHINRLANQPKLVHADPLAALGVGSGHTGGTPLPPKTREEPLAERADHTNSRILRVHLVYPL